MSKVAFLGLPTMMNLIGSLEGNEGFGQGDYFLVGKDCPSYIGPSNYDELIGSLEGNKGFGQGYYFLMGKDFPRYIECKEQVDEAYRDRKVSYLFTHAQGIRTHILIDCYMGIDIMSSIQYNRRMFL